MACVCKTCVFNREPGVSSHHHCTALLQHSAPAQSQVANVHHCEAGHSPGHGYCPSCPPHTYPGVVSTPTSHPAQCTGCSHEPSTLLSPHVNSHPCLSSPSSLPHVHSSHPHSPVSHPHTSHPHIPTSHHHPSPHISHPHTPASHHASPHISHPHTPASHHASPHISHPHTPTSPHPSQHISHPHTPASHHPSPHISHPHIPNSHHHNSTSYHHPHPSSLHHPTSHIHRAPFAASPLHQTHTWHRSHSPSYHPSPHAHHEAETQSPLAGYCTSTTCRIQPPHHPKSVCQVHPTRRQLIPNSPCLANGDGHPPTTQIASTPPQSILHHSNPHSPLSRSVQPPPQTPELLPPEGVDREVQSYTAVPQVAVYSTPPPNPSSRAHHVQQQLGLEFSPMDEAVSSNFSTDFELALPPSLNTDGHPVNSGKLPEPSQQHLPSVTDNVSESSFPAPPSPISTKSSSLSQSTQGASVGTSKSRGKATLSISKKRETQKPTSVRKSSPVNNPCLSFASDKIGREVVVLQHCATASLKTEPFSSFSTDSVSWDEFEKKFIQESGHGQRSEMKTEVVVETESSDARMMAEDGASRTCDGAAEVNVVGATASNHRITRSQAKILSDSEVSQPDEIQGVKHKMLTRSRLKDSSQSESDCPNTSDRDTVTLPPQKGSGEVKRSKRRKMKGKKRQSAGASEDGDSEMESFSIATRLRRRCGVRPKVLETSHSESEDSTTAVQPSKPVRQQSTSQSVTDTSVTVDDVSSVSDPAGNSDGESTQSNYTPSVHLTDWYIRIVGKNLVIVEGIKNDDKKRTWHSGPIVKRLSPRMVATRSGTIYHLEGPLHRAGLQKLDISGLTIDFEEGFPENWLSIIHNYLLQKIRTNKEGGELRTQSKEGRTDSEEGEEEVEKGEGGGLERERGGKEEVKKRTYKRAKQGRKQSKAIAADKCDGDKAEGEREGGEDALTSTPVSHGSTSQVNTDEDTTPRTRSIKTEQDPAKFTTPQATPLDTNIASDFISSLKRSSRGRTLKPASSSFTANTSMNIYSYDMRGNFIGLSSPVIDLTITSDTSGLLTSGNESVLLGQHVKREPTKQGNREGGTEEETETEKERKARRKKKSKKVTHVQRTEAPKEALKKFKKCKPRRVIPLALKKTKRSAVQHINEDHRDQEEGGSRLTPQETTLSCEVGREASPAGDHEESESRVAGRRREKRTDNKLHVECSDSIRKGAAEEGGEVEDNDFLVDTPGNTQGNVSTRKVKVQHKKSKRGVSISDQVVMMGEGGGDGGRGQEGGDEGSPKEWTSSEVQKLSRVVLSVPALAENFWEVVAHRIGNGHSAAECSSRYAEIRRRHKKKTGHGVSKDKTTQGKAPPPVLTARLGTMKRKRQVRDILDHLDSGYTDDVFNNSTPFKKSKLKDKQTAGNVEGTAEGKTDDDHLITTPREAWKRLGVPSTHTPRLCDYAATPDYRSGLKQGTADHVIYRKEKAKKRPKPLSKSSSVSHPSSTQPRSSQPTSTRNLHNIHSGELTVLRRFEDSDDSCDSNPFSDMEDACQDVIARLH